MNLKRCENGHFYDADKFASCPHCVQPTGGGASDPTVGAGNQSGGAVTVPGGFDMGPVYTSPEIVNQRQGGASSIRSDIEKMMTLPDPKTEEDDSKTIAILETPQGREPVVGWLVCVKGDYYGESFKLKTGRNFIGRSNKMDVVLAKDNSVSRDKHAIVLYEPKKREFIAQAGESRSLLYLNDEVVLMTEKLKKGDILTLGNTKLMFIPCCGPDFGWDECKNEE